MDAIGPKEVTDAASVVGLIAFACYTGPAGVQFAKRVSTVGSFGQTASTVYPVVAALVSGPFATCIIAAMLGRRLEYEYWMYASIAILSGLVSLTLLRNRPRATSLLEGVSGSIVFAAIAASYFAPDLARPIDQAVRWIAPPRQHDPIPDAGRSALESLTYAARQHAVTSGLTWMSFDGGSAATLSRDITRAISALRDERQATLRRSNPDLAKAQRCEDAVLDLHRIFEQVTLLQAAGELPEYSR